MGMRRQRGWFALVLAFAVLCLFPGTSPAADEVIGVIYPECCQAYETALGSLRDVLLKGGFSTDSIYEQKPSSDPMSWSNAFRKFVGVDADLIIIFGNELVEIACNEKTKVPVIFGFVSDPTGAKCVKSVDAPGKNVTGVSGRTPVFTLLEKSLRIKKFSTLGVFLLKGDRSSSQTLKEIESHGVTLGFSVVPIVTSKRSESAEALSSAPPFDVLFLPNFSIGEDEFKAIVAAAGKSGKPTISLRPSDEASSSLLSLYPDPAEQGRLMGELALKILGGGAPGQTAILNPKKIELELDVAKAKGLGLKVPLDILKSATKVRK